MAATAQRPARRRPAGEAPQLSGDPRRARREPRDRRNSAREALDRLLRTEFAVVIVDVCMPELDGFELAADDSRPSAIPADGHHLRLRCRTSRDLDRLRGYECGAVDYLPVPIVPEILRAKVNVFVELLPQDPAARTAQPRAREPRVAERTAELEDANRRKDEFLAVLAHELRNPLAADPHGRRARRPRRRVRRRTLDQACGRHRPAGRRTSAGWSTISWTSRASRAASSSCSASRPRSRRSSRTRSRPSQPLIAERAPHPHDRPIPDESLEVIGDAARLTQVVANILHNAAKFTDPGGRIELTVDADAAARSRSASWTTASASRPRCCRACSICSRRSIGRSTAPSTGLGVGLALVRRLVEMHGGQVTARSAGPGKGAEIDGAAAAGRRRAGVRRRARCRDRRPSPA